MQFCYSVHQKWASPIQCEMSTVYRKSFSCQPMYQCPTFTSACYRIHIYNTCLRASSYLICCRRNTAFFRSSCMLAKFSSAPSIDFTALKNNIIVGEGELLHVPQRTTAVRLIWHRKWFFWVCEDASTWVIEVKQHTRLANYNHHGVCQFQQFLK